jgi:uncharacterized protein
MHEALLCLNFDLQMTRHMQRSLLPVDCNLFLSDMSVVLMSISLASCTSDVQQAKPTQAIGLANPASINCVKQGGKLQIVDTSAGQVGICRFPNDKQCEEWAMLRGECKADSE